MTLTATEVAHQDRQTTSEVCASRGSDKDRMDEIHLPPLRAKFTPKGPSVVPENSQSPAAVQSGMSFFGSGFGWTSCFIPAQ